MTTFLHRFLAAMGLATALGLAAPQAFARGALGYDQDACVLKVGPDFLYFSGYQMGGDRRKFCEDVPTLGETTFVFDFAQDELRQMTTSFKIMRDTGETGEGGAPVDGPIVASLAPQVYPKGTFNFVHRFDEPGNYLGLVTIDGSGGEHWTARFPFSVASTPPAPKMAYVLLAVATALALGLFMVGRKDEKTKR